MRRKRSCEVCGEPGRSFVLVDDGTRRVVLCKGHADRAAVAGALTVEGLRTLFVEAGGRRALLPRRAVIERRLFPPRPEGRRLARGRRKSDATRAA
jgi:hypothetical protein